MSKKTKQKSIHTGSTFDSFLEEECIWNEVQGAAIKRVSTWQMEQDGGAEEDKAVNGERIRTVAAVDSAAQLAYGWSKN